MQSPEKTNRNKNFNLNSFHFSRSRNKKNSEKQKEFCEIRLRCEKIYTLLPWYYVCRPLYAKREFFNLFIHANLFNPQSWSLLVQFSFLMTTFEVFKYKLRAPMGIYNIISFTYFFLAALGGFSKGLRL